MDSFTYVMVLVSIIVGLGIAHLLSALGGAVHRLRGYGPPIRLDAVYLLWVGTVFLWLVGFWWWEFKLSDLDITWSIGLYLFVLFYAVVLYWLAVVLVPNPMDEVHDSYEYFMNGRYWFFSIVLLAIGFDIVDTFLKGREWGLRPVYLTQILIQLTGCATAMLVDRRGVQLAVALILFLLLSGFLFLQVATLGSW